MRPTVYLTKKELRTSLKSFDPTRIPYDIKDKDGQILEITLSRKLAHRNVIQYVNDDIYEMSNTKYPYIVTSISQEF